MTTRRSLVLGAGSALATWGLTGPAALAQESADAYPSRDIRAICAFPPGSGADVFARFFAEKTKPFLGKSATVLMENKVGASGNLAIIAASKAKPDGYTILVHAPSAVAANMHLFKNPGYDGAKDFDVVGTVSLLPFSVSVAADSPHKTLRDLIAAVKAKGDKATYATTAPTGQVAGAMMNQIAGLQALEVPYRTAADSVNDLTSGNLDYAMYDPIFALALARAGKIRVIALSSKERMKAAPDIPTMHEEGVTGVDLVGWWGALTPKGVPLPIREKIHKAFTAMAQSPETREFLGKFGSDPLALSMEEAQARFIADIDNWREYVRLAKIEPKG